ncbi:MAG TPA: hypothetical protein VFN10_08595, partial [Thermoanaerobaculia bacterium]|nr:hypothetical protein [Thermoanaerobaculia bacterium]
LYSPLASSETRLPVAVIVSGYRDPGFAAAIGSPFKEMMWTQSWARLFAASGVAAITYTNVDPVADLVTLFATLQERAEEWQIDATRVAIFASSGHVPTALSALLHDFPFGVSRGAFLYGYMLGEATANAAATFRFANPCAGRAIADVRTTPLLIARGGRDEMPGLNATIDAFVAAALAENWPLTLINHASAPHAFDLIDDSEASRSVIDAVVRFMSA